MKSLCIFPNPDMMAKEISSQLERYSNQAEKEGRIFSMVLSGGSACMPLYRRLAEQHCINKIPWHVIHLFWADERCVPPKSEESNYGVCRSVLLDYIPIPKDNIHRIRGEGDPAAESIRYAKEIHNHMDRRNGSLNFFDWIFLGVGTDGHTASLFPEHDLLNSPNLCDMVHHPQTAQIRITLTPLAIRQSHRITFLRLVDN